MCLCVTNKTGILVIIFDTLNEAKRSRKNFE